MIEQILVTVISSVIKDLLYYVGKATAKQLIEDLLKEIKKSSNSKVVNKKRKG